MKACVVFLFIVETLGLSLQSALHATANTTNTSFRLVFMVPANPDQEIEFNANIESIFTRSYIQNGWRVEANHDQTFYLYLIADTIPLDYHTHKAPSKQNANKASTTIIRKFRKRRDILTNNSKNYDTSDDLWWQSNIQFYIYLTLNPNSCEDYLEHTHMPLLVDHHHQTRRGLYKVPVTFFLSQSDQPYFICLSDAYFDVNNLVERKKRNIANFDDRFHHQGVRAELSILTYYSGVSSQWKILIYILLIILNSIFNGLNIGLMSLSISELELIIKTSDSLKERKYARNILPLRRHGNFLLCSILLSITLTSSVSVLLLDDLIQGLLAGTISTFVLCIFGEIMPQAICSKYALLIDSKTRKLTYLFMGFTCLCSWPLSKIVDWALGKELPIEYSRDALKYLITKSRDLKDKQCEIITGALEFKDRHIKDIMVPLGRVFMVDAGESLDFETMAAIYSSGFSRIPVFENERNNILGWFHVKDLSLIDSHDKLSVRTLIHLCKHKVAFCYTTDTLTNIFELFRHGSTHLAFVVDLIQDGDTDPYDTCVGIVTMHDIIEALLQFQLVDEATLTVASSSKDNSSSSATFGINYLKKLIDSHNHKISVNKSSENLGALVPMISLQTKFILSQILNNIKPFQEEFIDKHILEKIIMNEQNYIHRYIHTTDKSDSLYLYRYQHPSEYFILLLNGSFIIEAGVDKIELLAKQYDHFGERALLGECTTIEEVIENKFTHQSYLPEFSLKMDRTQSREASFTYLVITRNIWLSAVRSTYVRRSQLETN